jgi:hypothetical protein
MNNISRLWQMAHKRKQLANSGQPKSQYFDQPCIQCGDKAITKHTDLRFGEPQVSYWCNEDWDHWWMATTIQGLHRSGQISHVSQAIIPRVTEEDSVLLGWPD